VAEPWKCPDCQDWLAPSVTSHHCERPAAQPKAESEQPPGYAGHNGGSFERVSTMTYEPVRTWGFRP